MESDAIVVVVGGDVALMVLTNAFCDGKPQPVATGFTGARLIGTVKTFKQMAESVLAEWLTVVMNGEVDFFILLIEVYRNNAIWRRIFTSIIKKNVNELLELGGVAG